MLVVAFESERFKLIDNLRTNGCQNFKLKMWILTIKIHTFQQTFWWSFAHINSISRVARPSPRPTTRVDFDDGLFLCCLGICVLCFALKISSSAESGVAELFSSHATFPEYKTSVLKIDLAFLQGIKEAFCIKDLVWYSACCSLVCWLCLVGCISNCIH